MMYDFDTIIDRHGTGAVKWDIAPKSVAEKGYTPLTIADMEFKVAPEILAGMEDALRHGILGYTYPDDKYYDALAGFMQRRRGFKTERDWLIVTNGVVSALGLCVRAFTNAGEGVILQPPVYPPFAGAIKNNNRIMVENPLIFDGERYTIDYDDLEEKCSHDDTKLLLLCSPHNPVGRVWSYDELMRLGEICKRNNVLVIADEIHGELIMPGYKHTTFASIPGMDDNCVICTAMSKTFNLAGMGCSNLFVKNPDIRSKLTATISKEFASHMPVMARYAALAAFSNGDAWLDQLITYINGNLEYLYSFVESKLPMLKCIKTEGTYLAWLNCKALNMTDAELEEFMIEKAGLALDEGYIFGTNGGGFERINVAVPRSVLVDSLNRLEAAINTLN